MKAIIFAAGLGTRLGSLTSSRPKAMVELNGKPLLWHSIEKLKTCGISEIVVNVHHFADVIISYVKGNDFGLPINISDESEMLLDTGGGMLNARKWLDGDEPFVAYNVDIALSLNLSEVIAYHKKVNPLATLVVRQRNTSRYFLFDNDMRLTGWRNISTGEEKLSRCEFSKDLHQWAFSGIQVVSPKIFDMITETGKFSVTPMYLRLASNCNIIGYPDKSDFWMDLGTPDRISEAETKMQQQNKSIR